MKDFPEEFLKSIAPDSTRFLVGPWIITLTPDVVEPFIGIYLFIKLNIGELKLY